jgi:hypothetical protein
MRCRSIERAGKSEKERSKNSERCLKNEMSHIDDWMTR